ncbi:MAG: hypothetical protein U0893_16760 [Chloroflexota bacterium]
MTVRLMSLMMAHTRPPELTADPRMRQRVRRLALVSAVALGTIWGLARLTTEAPPATGLGLAFGWLLMPSLLMLSVRHPLVRYALAGPATLVSVALFTLLVWALPQDPPVRVGWYLVTGGVWFGSVLGIWLWFRWLPVPRALADPFSSGRWALIAVHASTIVAGFALLLVAMLRSS